MASDYVPLSGLQSKLVAGLAIHAGRKMATARLAFTLWGDAPPRSSVNRIQALVSDIRRRLTSAGVIAEVIETAGPGYRLLTDRLILDSLQFAERVGAAADLVRRGAPQEAATVYQQALDLWRGPAFDGVQELHDPDLPAVIAGLEAARARAFEEYIQVRLDLGEAETLIPELAAAIEQQPLRESLRGRLMLALARSDRTAEALDVFHQASRRLTNDLGIEPGPQLQRLYRAVLAGDPALLAVGSAHAPRMLPPPPAPLCGRQTELKVIQHALTAERTGHHASVVALHGPGGVGKSALAVGAAHACRDLFPDGQIYTDLQGSTPGLAPLTRGEVLARALRALGVPAGRVPLTDDEAAAVLRSRLVGKRVLILADNAASADQVQSVISAEPQCAVVVTSRSALPSLDATHLSVAPLEPSAAEAMVRELIGNSQTSAHATDVAAVARACSYLPLAIRIATGRMIVRPDWTIAELAARLTDRQTALHELTSADDRLRDSFAVAWQALARGDEIDALAIRVFLLFGGVFVHDLDLDAIAAFLDVPLAEARAGVDRLVELHLVEAAGGRYRPHDVLRLFAAETAAGAANDARQHLTRALRWYEGGARQASELTGRPVWHGSAHRDPTARHPVFTDNQQAGRWLDAERANLLAVVQQGTTVADLLPALSADLAASLYPCFIMRNHNREYEAICLAVLDIAGDRITDTSAGRICVDLGMLYRMQDRHDEALQRLNQALAHYGDDLNGQSRALSVIAHVHVGRGDPQAALPVFDEAIRLRRATGDPIGEATTLSNAAEAYHLLGRSDTALELLHRSLLLRRETADLVGEAITNENLAEVYLALARPAEAKPHADAAVECARRCDAREVERRALTLRARIWLAAGNPTAARSDCQDGLALAAAAKPTNLGDLRELAKAFRDAGDEAAAAKIDGELAALTDVT